MKKTTRFALFGSMLFVTACGSPALIRPLQDTDFPPKPKYYPVLVTTEVPDKPFDVIAEVRTRPYEGEYIRTAGEAELRSLARKLGGDAVIQVNRKDDVRESFGYRPGSLLRLGTRFEARSFLSGLVVRFTGNP